MQSLNLDALGTAQQEEVLATMGELIFKDVLVRCLEVLSPKQRETFAAVAAEGNPDKAGAYLEQHIEELDQIVADAVGDLSRDILSVIKP